MPDQIENKPQMDGKVSNLFHLVNRATKTLKAAGVDDEKISHMRNRCLHENPDDRIELKEAKRIVGEYVEYI